MFALVVTLLAALPASAALRYDGTVPIYPNGVVQGESQMNPQQFRAMLKTGTQMNISTSDAPATVANWYRANLPASFSVHIVAAGARFVSGNKIVAVYKAEGKTQIVILPG